MSKLRIDRRHVAVVLAVLGLATLALMLGLGPMVRSSATTTAGASEAVQVVGSASVYEIPESLDANTRRADSVALVTVERISPARWNTSDGKAPAGPIQQAIQAGQMPVIYRAVTFRVEKYLKNPQPDSLITVHQLGGEVDGAAFEGPRTMMFKEGQKAIVFLARQKSPSPVAWDLYTAYTIDGAIARSEWDRKSVAMDELLTTVAKVAGNGP